MGSRLFLLLIFSVVAACSEAPGLPRPDGGESARDAASRDGGATADAGPSGDAGNTVDGSVPQDDGGVAPLPCSLDDVLDLSSRVLGTCALTRTGSVSCWGEGSHLDDSTVPVANPQVPRGVVQISAGFQHFCVRTSTGGVACWGNNEFGQLGDGTLSSTDAPVQVVGLSSGVLDVSAGIFHSCAVLAGGSVRCWGRNADGELGDDTTEDRPTPVEVRELTGASDVEASEGSSCARAGTVMKCWGNNRFGILGDRTTENRHTPVEVAGLPRPVAQIATGITHSCAILDDESLWCWGYNYAGQLGDGTQATSMVPLRIGTGFTQVGLGTGHSCGLTRAGVVRCWGENAHGKLGDGKETWGSSLTATVSLPRPAIDIAVGNQSACALLDDRAIHCWGRDESAELGNGNRVNLTPAKVPGVAAARQVAVGAFHACAVTARGAVDCWGSAAFSGEAQGFGSNGAAVRVAGLPGDVTLVKAGSYHSCARSANGELFCWGSNGYGQLGDGNSVPRQQTAVRAIAFGATVRDFAGGWGHTCVILPDGRAKCAGGYNAWGQLGDGTEDDSVMPVDVRSGGVALQTISLGLYHSCATSTAADAVYCWGNNQASQLGRFGDTSLPGVVEGITERVVAMEAGGFSTCVLDEDNAVQCLGSHLTGMIGPFSKQVVELAVAESHLCVRFFDGGVACAGDNQVGQLGNGPGPSSRAPVLVALDGPATSLDSTGHATCVSLEDGTVACWGADSHGQISARFGGYPRQVRCQ